MSRNIKIIIIVAVLVLLTLLGGTYLARNNKKKETSANNQNKINIVVTSFSGYDFVKHIVGDTANVEFLLGPGVDAHSYDPTASDLVKIQNSDMFVYIGGEMEKWTEKVLTSGSLNTNKTQIVKVTDAVKTIDEQEVDGAEPEEEEEEEDPNNAFDEHIWTSPANAIKMMEYLNNILATRQPEYKDTYTKNSEEYINQIKDIQAKIKSIVDNKKRNVLVFGDKMPMQYFLNEYGLKASAAFSGCSTETEPSSKTISYLVSKVKDNKIPVVLYIELSTGKTAKTIAQETGAKAIQIQTLHNVSKDDFEKGESYVSLMSRNIEVLKQALQ